MFVPISIRKAMVLYSVMSLWGKTPPISPTRHTGEPHHLTAPSLNGTSSILRNIMSQTLWLTPSQLHTVQITVHVLSTNINIHILLPSPPFPWSSSVDPYKFSLGHQGLAGQASCHNHLMWCPWHLHCINPRQNVSSAINSIRICKWGLMVLFLCLFWMWVGCTGLPDREQSTFFIFFFSLSFAHPLQRPLRALRPD